MKTIILILSLLISTSITAQIKSDNFAAHENLLGGLWKTEAKWGDGTPHNLEVAYSSSLDGTIIKTKTYGITDKETKAFGLRNEGIRYFNAETKTIEFYEFDIFGGLTKGNVKYIENNIFYTYNYGAGDNAMKVTDGWEFIDKDTYKYTIGVYDFETKTWKQAFLKAEMHRQIKD